MRIDVISIFPEMFEAITGYGIPGRAIKKDLLQLRVWNPRDYTDDKHRSVDDRPYGGGPGDGDAGRAAGEDDRGGARRTAAGQGGLSVTPGAQADHAAVKEFSTRAGVILLAGRYEGVDERLLASEVDEEWSIGDYVLSGGELPAMVLIDAIARQLPGVLGDEDSAAQDSFVTGLLDCPHYTRPEMVAGRPVPEVLLSGNHEQIRRWRLKQMLGRTWLRRPDLLEPLQLNDEQQRLLEEFRREHSKHEEK